MTYALYGIIALQLCLSFVQAFLHRCERRELYDRIMSRGLSDYRGEKCSAAKSAHERVLRRWRGEGGEEGKDGEGRR